MARPQRVAVINYRKRDSDFADRLSFVIDELAVQGYEIYYLSPHELDLELHPALAPRITCAKRRFGSGFLSRLWLLASFPFWLFFVSVPGRFKAVLFFEPSLCLLGAAPVLFAWTRTILILDELPWITSRTLHKSVLLRTIRNILDFAGLFCARLIVATTTSLAEGILQKTALLKRRIHVLHYSVVRPEELIVDEETTVAEAGNKGAPDQSEEEGDRARQPTFQPPKRSFAVGLEQWEQWLNAFSVRKRKLAHKFGLPEKSLFVSISGDANAEQLVDQLVRAVGGLANDKLCLILVGSGLEQKKIMTFAVGYGLVERLVFADWFEDPSGVIAASDLFVAGASSSRIPHWTLAALGAGTAVIAPETPEMRELLGYDELLFDQAHVGELERIVQSAVEGRSELEKLRQLSRERIAQLDFCWGERAADLIEGQS